MDEGTWEQISEGVIYADFDEKVGGTDEPFIISLEGEGDSISVASDSSHWSTDYYFRQ